MKLFASDLDGTFLDHKHEVNEYGYDIIETIKQTQNIFSVVTGRSYQSVKNKFKKDQDFDFIVLNGAMVYHDSKLIHSVSLKKDLVDKIINLLNKYQEYYLVYGEKETFTNSLIAQFIQTFIWSKNIKKAFGVFQEFKKLRNINFKVYKIEGSIKNPKLINLLQDIPEINAIQTGRFTFEITDINATKKQGILALLKHYKLNEDDVYCFGDSLNDFSMFEYFKNSYAVSNARIEIKNLAKEVILSNNENGVYYKIKEILNGK